jgi:hypothetical protein
MAAATPAPADDDPDTTGADAGADAGGDDTDAGGDTHGDGETVLCTICKNADGSYTVHEGDEPEGEDEGEGGGESAQEPGQELDSIGAVLKAVMDILREEAEGSGTSQEGNFTAGFEGGSGASQPRAMAATMRG